MGFFVSVNDLQFMALKLKNGPFDMYHGSLTLDAMAMSKLQDTITEHNQVLAKEEDAEISVSLSDGYKDGVIPVSKYGQNNSI